MPRKGQESALYRMARELTLEYPQFLTLAVLLNVKSCERFTPCHRLSQKMELIDEILSDRATGTRRLVEEYGARLHETALRLCGNAADAEDYTFRTLERAVDRIHLFARKSSLFTWLYEILVNIIRADARRKAANSLVFRFELPDREDERPNVGEVLSAEDEAAIVRKAVRELATSYRALLVFRYYEDLTVPEIARILSLPEGTVKRRLHEAKNLVRAQIARTIRPTICTATMEVMTWIK